jgi:hypothetical protein
MCGVAEEDKSTKKKEERDKKGEQLKEVSLLQSSPYQPTMVVEVCCHHDELLIAVKVCYFHQDFFISFLFF